MARIDGWNLISRVDAYGNPYQRIAGTAYSHPKANADTTELCDGHHIITSDVVFADWAAGVIVTRSGTTYELGEKYIGGK